MHDTNDAQTDCNVNTPNVARIYDYYLGGKHNYETDREAARKVLGVAPDVPMAALENRAFLQRAVRFLVQEAGISQYVDIGPGLPTQGNVHQIVQQYAPGARVVYIDNDPFVVQHGQSLLSGQAGISIASGDLRHPDQLLGNPILRELIDLNKPVGLCMTLVLHFIPESEGAHEIVGCLLEALCPGSCIVISHVTDEGREARALSDITDTYNQATAPLVMRSRDEISSFFNGTDLINPGLVFLSQWRPSSESYTDGGTRWAYAGVGRKPGGTR
ncbi:MAG TPA: SAM-dependent methyltransferase [Streptosporangiaceae bacterium]|nr:SAM-dependent methyltransferase [Streptosporangiaceae bacterium]